MSILTDFYRKIKGHFSPKPTPRTTRTINIYQALDRSLAYGYASVKWEAVRYV